MTGKENILNFDVNLTLQIMNFHFLLKKKKQLLIHATLKKAEDKTHP